MGESTQHKNVPNDRVYVMRQKSVGWGIVLLLIVITLGIILQNNRVETVYMSASWAYGYADVQDLTRHSDVIALIKVDQLSETIGGKVPASVYQVTVTDGIRGCQTDEQLFVYMTGGRMGKKMFVIESDPLMEEGQEFLIFAQQNADGTCTVLGGPQGRLVYKNGTLNSLHNTTIPHVNRIKNADSTTMEKFEGTVNVINESLEDVKKEIQSVLQ